MFISGDVALGIGMLALWLALLVAFVWHPVHRCENAYCPHRAAEPRVTRRDR